MSGYFLIGVAELRDPDGKKLYVWSRKPFVSDLCWMAAYLRRQKPAECGMRFVVKSRRAYPNKRAAKKNPKKPKK